MPTFKEPTLFQRSSSTEFDRHLLPGTPALHSGIYRCQSCGFEVATTRGVPLPISRFCSEHSPGWRGAQRPVSWQLVAYAIQKS